MLKRLLLVGGGHAHIEVLRALAAQPVANWEITLVSPFDRLIYSGMFPGYIAGHYRIEECAVDLASLANRAGAAFQRAAASLVDPGRREVALADGTAREYDLLSLNVGALVLIGEVPGVERHAIPIRPLEYAAQAWERVVERAGRGEVGAVTLVGGGVAGVELALAMRRRLPDVHVRVITDKPEPLSELAPGARVRLVQRLAARGIGVHCGNAVREVGEGVVKLARGLQFTSDATFWATGPAAPDVIRDSGFAIDERGYLATNEYLQSTSHADVFGAGDCATQVGRARPKAGVFAVRAAPTLARNLRAAMTGAALEPHRTGKHYLALISTGDRHAVGVWNGFSWEGAWAWRWKDGIDRGFVKKYGSREPRAESQE